MKVRVFNIKYDTDGMNISSLPKEFVFELDDPEFEVADAISDETGWCVFSCEYEEIH